jgi:hypothetical protein
MLQCHTHQARSTTHPPKHTGQQAGGDVANDGRHGAGQSGARAGRGAGLGVRAGADLPPGPGPDVPAGARQRGGRRLHPARGSEPAPHRRHLRGRRRVVGRAHRPLAPALALGDAPGAAARRGRPLPGHYPRAHFHGAEQRRLLLRLEPPQGRTDPLPAEDGAQPGLLRPPGDLDDCGRRQRARHHAAMGACGRAGGRCGRGWGGIGSNG